MASQQIIFKSACPSCEALIPIRDEGFIGKKIECPKCKYRFVVEEPEGMGGEAGAPKRKAKKKAKSNAPLFIGLGVGAVAIGVLGVVGALVFGGGGDSSKPKPRPVAINNSPPKDTPPAGEPTKPENKATTETPEGGDQAVAGVADADSSGDITNLLPNDSKMVVAVNMDKLRFSAFGEQMFESKTGLRPNAFKEKIGIGHDEMKKFVRGEDPDHHWGFSVIRTFKPVNFKDMEKAMTLKKKAPIKGRDYYEIPQNELLDNIGAALRPASEASARRNRSAGPLCLLLLDQTTVVIANQEPMEEFLKHDAKQHELSIPAKRANDPANPGDGGGPAKPRRPGRGRGQSQYGMSMLQAPGDDPHLVQNATFLSIEPPLKAMMDHLDSDPKVAPIFYAAVNLQTDPQLGNRIKALPGLSVLPTQAIRTFGVVLNKYELEKFYGTVGAEFFNENDVKEFEGFLKKNLHSLAQLLGLYLRGIKVETEGADGGSTGSSPGSGAGKAGGPGSGGMGQGPGGLLPGFQPSDDGPVSKLKLKRNAHYIFVEGEINTPLRAHEKIMSLTEGITAKMRGLIDMHSPTPLWKELSGAVVKSLEGGTVPRGTYVRAEPQGGRFARSWPPSQRVSWMVGLLPHLGMDDVYRQIQRDKSWRDTDNLKPASLLVPPFLDPRLPERTWYANLDSLASQPLGATHYVGVAGVGLEAADYKADDPAMAKKLGAFGYDRAISTKDVTDGLANTIFMIETPPNYQRPWIAGGGATIMGVPETKSIRPFVGNFRGQRGTYVVMMDGSVRFISENISDEVFKSLVTIKGGESIDDLEKIAPKAKPSPPRLRTETKDDEKPDENKDDKSDKDDKPDIDK